MTPEEIIAHGLMLLFWLLAMPMMHQLVDDVADSDIPRWRRWTITVAWPVIVIIYFAVAAFQVLRSQIQDT